VPVARISLASRSTSAREARDLLTNFLGTWGSEVARDIATLLLSEVVTNAVRHARGGAILMTLTLSPGQFLAQVHDESAQLPVKRDVGEAGGWGLELIDRLANRWGVDQHPGDGKTVWFEVDKAGSKDRS
jgi:two-component sensor histidine kinase